MNLSRLSVLSAEEIRRIHDASMRILETVGIRIDHGKARGILGFLCGSGIATAYVLPWSMVPDVIEYDQEKTARFFASTEGYS